jgi:5-methylcytosine-specific restriction endonuclease McrA
MVVFFLVFLLISSHQKAFIRDYMKELEFSYSEEHKEHIRKKSIIQKKQFDLSIEAKKNFYSSDLWKEIRAYMLNNYENECSYCLSKKSLQIDHIRPISTNPSRSLKLINLQILCKNCNQLKSNLGRKRYGMKKKPNWKPFHIKNIQPLWMDFFKKIN